MAAAQLDHRQHRHCGDQRQAEQQRPAARGDEGHRPTADRGDAALALLRLRRRRGGFGGLFGERRLGGAAGGGDMGVDRALRRRKLVRLGGARPRQGRAGLEQEIGAVERARRGDRRRALRQIARRGADGAERLVGETRRRAGRGRGGRSGSGQGDGRGGARFVDAGDLVLEPAEPADHALENVLHVGEARLGPLVGIPLLGAQFGEAVGDRRARRLHRATRRIELVDQIGDALFERGAGTGACKASRRS